MSMPRLSSSSLLGATFLGTFVLYGLLAPGFIVTLPGGMYGQCKNLVPGPTDLTNDCDAESPDANMVDICKARDKCTNNWATGYTNPGAAWLHALVFALLQSVVIYLIATYGGQLAKMVS
jgi:hypothetical protein